MKGKYLYFIFLIMLSLSFVDCAKRGYPEGGPRDSIPPVITRSVPANYSTNFTAEEIRINFNEYIKLKDINQEIIISPPLENQPSITPLSAGRYINVIFNDTLKENTTYTINFGKSIVDYNEENPLEFHKYVFSTGSYIDSLKVEGTITDALLPAPAEDVTVMLYEVNDAYTDSVVYNKKPYYVSTTKNNPGFFSIENIKAGKYLLVALKDNNSNYTFEPHSDKIGFADTFIEVPTDSIYNLNLFKEIPAYTLARPTAEKEGRAIFGYEGPAKVLSIEMLTETPENFEYHITKDPVRDTLNYWFKPQIERDSLQFMIANEQYIDTVKIRLREGLVMDTLIVKPEKTGALAFDELFELSANLPIISYDKERISIMDKDSIMIPFTANLDIYFNSLKIDFEKEERQNYTIDILPDAFKDFFGNTNDTLQFRTTTRSVSDYGFLSLNVINLESFPVIVQLVNERGDVKKEIFSEERTSFEFENLTPGKYYIRIVFDSNANGIWDTGSFLQRRQPERVVYYPNLLDVRANWTLSETFVLE